MIRILPLCILFLSFSNFAQVLIFTYAYNRPDFIEIQHKTFQKFLLDDYEFVVFNDAKDKELEHQIDQTCANLNIRCIRIPQTIHTYAYLERLNRESLNSPTVRNVNVVQYSLNTLGFDHNDIVVLLDSDLFLVKPLSVREFLHGYDLGGSKKGNGNVSFLWHGLAFLDMRSMPNKQTLTFNCGQINGHPIDAGGYSYFYLRDNPDLKTRWFGEIHSSSLRCDSCKKSDYSLCTHNTSKLQQEGFNEKQIAFLQSAINVEFFYKNTFLHYRGGSNWDNKKHHYHKMKTKALNTYINAILN